MGRRRRRFYEDGDDYRYCKACGKESRLVRMGRSQWDLPTDDLTTSPVEVIGSEPCDRSYTSWMRRVRLVPPDVASLVEAWGLGCRGSQQSTASAIEDLRASQQSGRLLADEMYAARLSGPALFSTPSPRLTVDAGA